MSVEIKFKIPKESQLGETQILSRLAYIIHGGDQIDWIIPRIQQDLKSEDPAVAVEKVLKLIQGIEDCKVGAPPFQKQQDGYHWVIGSGNNWWFQRDMTFVDDKLFQYMLIYRYGGVEFMAKLRDIIIYFLDIERFNKA